MAWSTIFSPTFTKGARQIESASQRSRQVQPETATRSFHASGMRLAMSTSFEAPSR